MRGRFSRQLNLYFLIWVLVIPWDHGNFNWLKAIWPETRTIKEILFKKSLSWSLAFIVGLLLVTVIEQVVTWFSCKQWAIWQPNRNEIADMDEIYILGDQS